MHHFPLRSEIYKYISILYLFYIQILSSTEVPCSQFWLMKILWTNSCYRDLTLIIACSYFKIIPRMYSNLSIYHLCCTPLLLSVTLASIIILYSLSFSFSYANWRSVSACLSTLLKNSQSLLFQDLVWQSKTFFVTISKSII